MYRWMFNVYMNIQIDIWLFVGVDRLIDVEIYV